MPMQIQYQVIALVLLIGLLIFGFLVPEQIQKRKKAKEIDSIVSGDRGLYRRQYFRAVYGCW